MTQAESLSVLAEAKHVTLKQLPDGVEVRISPKASQLPIILAATAVATLCGVAGAIVLYKYLGLVRKAVKLGALSLMGFMGLMIMLLVRLGSGKPKEQVTVVRTGAIAVDRYVQGDHVVRSFNPDEVVAVCSEIGRVFVSTRIGETAVADSLSGEAADALARMAAEWLWQGRTIETVSQEMGYGIVRRMHVPSALAAVKE